MTTRLPAYPEYRESRLPWLPKTPDAWRTQRVKTVLREVDRRTATGTEPLLSLRMGVGLVDHHAAGGRPIPPENLIGYKITTPGEVVMNRMRAAMGLFAVTCTTGLVSRDYAVFERIAGVEPEYLVRLFQTPVMTTEFRRESKGLGTGQSGFLRLYSNRFEAMHIPLPPPDDQKAIIRYLAQLDGEIRRIAATQRSILALLEEQRRAILRRYVTRGLDPGAALRPSGVDRLGDIPAHWQATRVKAEFSCLNARRVPLSSTTRGQMTAWTFDYYGASGVIDRVDDYLFDDELILIAEDGANLVLRNLPLAIIARGKFWVNNHAHVLQPRSGNIEYLAALLETVDYRPWITGAAQPKLTKDRLMAIPIAVPPRPDQDGIAQRIDRDTVDIRRAIAATRQQIALVKEYGARLAADVVTGQVDVRAAAEQFPEVADRGSATVVEPLDADDDLDDEDDPDSAEAGEMDEMSA